MCLEATKGRRTRASEEVQHREMFRTRSPGTCPNKSFHVFLMTKTAQLPQYGAEITARQTNDALPLRVCCLFVAVLPLYVVACCSLCGPFIAPATSLTFAQLNRSLSFSVLTLCDFTSSFPLAVLVSSSVHVCCSLHHVAVTLFQSGLVFPSLSCRFKSLFRCFFVPFLLFCLSLDTHLILHLFVAVFFFFRVLFCISLLSFCAFFRFASHFASR